MHTKWRQESRVIQNSLVSTYSAISVPPYCLVSNGENLTVNVASSPAFMLPFVGSIENGRMSLPDGSSKTPPASYAKAIAVAGRPSHAEAILLLGLLSVAPVLCLVCPLGLGVLRDVCLESLGPLECDIDGFLDLPLSRLLLADFIAEDRVTAFFSLSCCCWLILVGSRVQPASVFQL